ncbi:MAG: DUF4348 domain-containing protein [Prevotella sp.]|jgi:hypothetical protein|nr:DUF4348 domain-containing protein [Prevotella sp.]MCI1281070.1 DUF4348 domain-containing protein [Prevotella sp.]
MKKCAFLFMVLLIITIVSFSTAGCSNKKPAAVDSTNTDSVIDTSAVDTMESIIEEQPVSKAADELFDDFFFNFAGNRKLQVKRINFPLSIYRNGKLEKQIQKPQWVIDRFFMRQDYYTLIFDNHKQMQVVKDTTIDHVVVEKIFFKTSTVKQYLFNRINGLWMLTSINYKPMYQNNNASFLRFYKKFAVDSAYQIRSMNEAVTFTAPDPDDEFHDITGTMAPEQWPMFKPALIPHGVIYNILYGQTYTESNQKIFVVRGIANGLEIEMTFRNKGGRWKLMKFNS